MEFLSLLKKYIEPSHNLDSSYVQMLLMVFSFSSSQKQYIFLQY